MKKSETKITVHDKYKITDKAERDIEIKKIITELFIAQSQQVASRGEPGGDLHE